MSVSNPTLITFVIYIAAMVLIGFMAYRSTNNLSDYILGGRSLGSVVTALSAGASDMSGWLLMGLPGAIYMSGLSESWIAFGLVTGNEQPVQVGTDSQADGDPGFGKARHVDGARQAHQQPAAHVRGTGRERGHHAAEAAATEDVIGKVVGGAIGHEADQYHCCDVDHERDQGWITNAHKSDALALFLCSSGLSDGHLFESR